MKRKIISKEVESVFDAVITFYANENWDAVWHHNCYYQLLLHQTLKKIRIS